MRKLYALFAGLVLLVTGIKIQAQTATPDVANFTFTVHTGNNVSFTNTSVLGNSSGERRAWWSFGDGTMQSSPPLGNMQHHYNAAGTYTVCLKIYRYQNNDSVLSASVCKTVVLSETTCSADFQFVDSIITGPPPAHKVKFYALASHSQNRPITEICWNFGDGSPEVCVQSNGTVMPSSLLVTNHIYTQPGRYNVCVRIKFLEGCIAEKCKIVELPAISQADSCRSNFERINVSATTNPLQATFKAIPWHSNNKKPAKICWQFGDGRDTCINYDNAFTGLYTVSHTYATMGLYEVCAKIVYQGGCEARKCSSVRIGRADSCSADFGRLPGTNTANPLSVILKALPWHSNNLKPQKICWQFGDGRDTCIEYLNIYNGTYTVPHTYSQPGAYQICVKIVYFGGCEARKCETVRIEEPATCQADFERIQSPNTNPRLVYFKALTSNSTNRKPQKICWQFGDGRDTCITYPENYTGLYAVSHQYTHGGQYEVCVKITYYGGCEARKCRMIQLEVPEECGADFERLTGSANNPLLNYFKAIPSHSGNKKPSRICWQFGNGRDTCINYPENYTGQYAVSHLYSQPGQYEVCVKITYYGGCEARKCRSISIQSGMNTCGGYMKDSLAGPRTYKFKGFSIHSPGDEVVHYRWTYGDGTSDMGQEVSHTYTSGGPYEVCLYIKTRNGCESRICKTVTVPGTNIPALIVSPNPVGSELRLLFTSTHNEPVTIKIMNSNGFAVQTYTQTATIGTNTWSYIVSTLMPGSYTVMVQSPNQMASALFLKL